MNFNFWNRLKKKAGIGEKIYDELLHQNKILYESLKAHVFRDSISDIDWVKNKNFTLSGMAGNYSFLYVLFRILNDLCPTSIIEFGIGQTSKLTSQYVAYKNTNAQLFLVEHDAAWISFAEKQIVKNNNIIFLHLPINQIQYNNFVVDWYCGVQNAIGSKKFDLIIVDGPLGSHRYSRIGVLDLIPQNLDKKFVIIIDDYNRPGEKETTEEICKKLSFLNIEFEKMVYEGIKIQIIIFSKSFDFLKYL